MEWRAGPRGPFTNLKPRRYGKPVDNSSGFTDMSSHTHTQTPLQHACAEETPTASFRWTVKTHTRTHAPWQATPAWCLKESSPQLSALMRALLMNCATSPGGVKGRCRCEPVSDLSEKFSSHTVKCPTEEHDRCSRWAVMENTAHHTLPTCQNSMRPCVSPHQPSQWTRKMPVTFYLKLSPFWKLAYL